MNDTKLLPSDGEITEIHDRALRVMEYREILRKKAKAAQGAAREKADNDLRIQEATAATITAELRTAFDRRLLLDDVLSWGLIAEATAQTLQ